MNPNFQKKNNFSSKILIIFAKRLKLIELLSQMQLKKWVPPRESHKWPKKLKYSRFSRPLNLEEFREKTFKTKRKLFFYLSLLFISYGLFSTYTAPLVITNMFRTS